MVRSPEIINPSEHFEKVVRILRFTASVCGIDLLRPNYRMNWITYTLFTSITAYYVFVFHTIWTNYQDDWTIFVRASVTLGSSFQGVSKLITFISSKDDIMSLYQLLSGIYRKYGQMRGMYTEALHACLLKTVTGMYALMLMNIIGYMGVVAIPYIWLLITGERFLVIEFLIPGLDVATDWGYFCTLGFQSVMLTCYGFGLFCGDMVALLYLMQPFMFSYIFAAKVQTINDLIANAQNVGHISISTALIDIAKWHQQFSEYTKNCNKLFFYVITVQIITAFCSTVLSIYLIITGSWPGAYAYVAVATCSLYMYCILGTANEKANQKFEFDIYNIHWYKMTLGHQKIVLQILYKTQHPITIDIGGIMPLSMNTALRITKTVYSITMLMVQFLME